MWYRRLALRNLNLRAGGAFSGTSAMFDAICPPRARSTPYFLGAPQYKHLYGGEKYCSLARHYTNLKNPHTPHSEQ
jgi:hypothetical protein